jgi:Mg2+ and Co2+ transporter CorA
VRWAKLGSDSRCRVTFEDLQQLNKLSDLVIRVIHALQLNLDVLKMLSREAITRAAIEGDELVEQYDEFQDALRTCITEHTFLVHHASLVRDNAVRISTQVSLQNLAILGFFF